LFEKLKTPRECFQETHEQADQTHPTEYDVRRRDHDIFESVRLEWDIKTRKRERREDHQTYNYCTKLLPFLAYIECCVSEAEREQVCDQETQRVYRHILSTSICYVHYNDHHQEGDYGDRNISRVFEIPSLHKYRYYCKAIKNIQRDIKILYINVVSILKSKLHDRVRLHQVAFSLRVPYVAID
jgi:hypothetical protein